MNTEPGWKRLPTWVHSHYFYKADMSVDSKDNSLKLTSPSQANLVSSLSHVEGATAYHKPLIDLDIRAELIPSSTPGHSHLYIDKMMTAEQYGRLLAVLVEVGIVQQGIMDNQWIAEGHTALRLPGIKKQITEKSSAGSPIAEPESSFAIEKDDLWANAEPLTNENIQMEFKPKLKFSLSDIEAGNGEVADKPSSMMMDAVKEFGEIVSIASIHDQPPAEMLGLFFAYLEAKHKIENPEAPPAGVVNNDKSFFDDLFPKSKTSTLKDTSPF